MMMGTMSMAPQIPEHIGAAAMSQMLNLLAVLANPEAAKTLLEQLATARDEAKAALDDAVARSAAVEVAEREHKKRIKREREEHEKALAAAQASFDQECAAREK